MKKVTSTILLSLSLFSMNASFASEDTQELTPKEMTSNAEQMNTYWEGVKESIGNLYNSAGEAIEALKSKNEEVLSTAQDALGAAAQVSKPIAELAEQNALQLWEQAKEKSAELLEQGKEKAQEFLHEYEQKIPDIYVEPVPEEDAEGKSQQLKQQT